MATNWTIDAFFGNLVRDKYLSRDDIGKNFELGSVIAQFRRIDS